MKIGVVQMMARADKEENLAIAEKYIAEAAARGADLVALPEMFCCPMVHKFYREFAEPKYGLMYRTLRDIAKKNKVFLLGGTVPERSEQDGKIFNTSWTFDPEGREIYEYKKRRLFDISLRDGREFKESRTFARGTVDPSVFETPFGKMGLAICFELRFVEDFLKLEQDGARVCFVPANFSIPTGEVHWELLFRARALDSQFYVVGIGGARDPQSKFMSYGHSIVVDPWGDVLWQAGAEECVQVVSLDLDEIERRREELPVSTSRRESAMRK